MDLKRIQELEVLSGLQLDPAEREQLKADLSSLACMASELPELPEKAELPDIPEVSVFPESPESPNASNPLKLQKLNPKKKFRSLTMAQALQLKNESPDFLQKLTQAMKETAVKENRTLGAYTDFLPGENNAQQIIPQHINGPLTGITAAIKANIAGKNWPTHCGSRLLANYRSPYDSTVVERLRAAGCGFSGVTTMDEFGMGSSCEHTTMGRVVNPWNLSCSAGGSSGGSAAAVAAGLAWFALGSDTGGSVRLPAHFCGVVGLKPTYGRISRFGLVAFVSSLDTVGILARDVVDAHLVFNTLAGHDPRDGTSSTHPVDTTPLKMASSLEGVSLGVPDELADMDLSTEVRRNHQESLERLRALGAVLIPVSTQNIFNTVPVYTVLNCAEAASNLHRYDGTLYGVRQQGATDRDSLVATRSRGFGPEVKRRLLMGAHVLSAGYRKQYYLKACAARQSLTRKFENIFRLVDMMVLPTASTTAFSLGSFSDDPVRMHMTDILTVPASLAGMPALNIPTGLDSKGLPHSLQLIGPAWSEKKLLECALVLEQDLQFRFLKEAPWQSSL